MNCLLTAATYAEIAPAVTHYQNAGKRWHIDFELDVLITGVGMLPAVYALTRHVLTRKPDLIVQAGIAGCFHLATPLAKVFAVQSEALADTGVRETSGWQDVFDLQLMKKNTFPFKGGRLVNADKTLLQRCKLPLAKAVTVNQVSTNKKNIAAIAAKYKPRLESMEGAALHYVALQQQVPFLQIRAVSNYVGERNKKKWAIAPAIDNLNIELIRLFEAL
jgi:futalosine hydrolase